MLFPREFIETHGTAFPAWSPEDARAYARELSRAHYENFQVVSFLLPKRLHQDFFHIYAFCRWADDLGDEMGDRGPELLAWWRAELEAMYDGHARHPVYVALAETVERHAIEPDPFRNLITAFERDQTETRYQSYDDVLDYCVYSANPVGRLVLHLGGYTDAARRALSDKTCTALQLANHWQDVRRDFEERNRIYLPQDVLTAHGASHETLAQDLRDGSASPELRAAVRDLVDRAEALFEQGLPLCEQVDRRLAVDLELFSRGGLAVLDKIRAQDYDVVRERPRVGKFDRLRLLAGVLFRRTLGIRAPAAKTAAASESS